MSKRNSLDSFGNPKPMSETDRLVQPVPSSANYNSEPIDADEIRILDEEAQDEEYRTDTAINFGVFKLSTKWAFFFLGIMYLIGFNTHMLLMDATWANVFDVVEVITPDPKKPKETFRVDFYENEKKPWFGRLFENPHLDVRTDKEKHERDEAKKKIGEQPSNMWFDWFLFTHSIFTNVGSLLFIFLQSLTKSGKDKSRNRGGCAACVANTLKLSRHWLIAMFFLFVSHIPLFYVAMWTHNLSWGVIAVFFNAIGTVWYQNTALTLCGMLKSQGPAVNYSFGIAVSGLPVAALFFIHFNKLSIYLLFGANCVYILWISMFWHRMFLKHRHMKENLLGESDSKEQIANDGEDDAEQEATQYGTIKGNASDNGDENRMLLVDGRSVEENSHKVTTVGVFCSNILILFGMIANYTTTFTVFGIPMAWNAVFGAEGLSWQIFFLIYTLGDICGRPLNTLQFGTGKKFFEIRRQWILILVILVRMAIVGCLYLLLLAWDEKSREDAKEQAEAQAKEQGLENIEKVVVRSSIGADLFKCVVQFFFAVTNGWLTSETFRSGFAHAGGDRHRQLIGPMLGFCLVFGIYVGSTVSNPLKNFVIKKF